MTPRPNYKRALPAYLAPRNLDGFMADPEGNMVPYWERESSLPSNGCELMLDVAVDCLLAGRADWARTLLELSVKYAGVPERLDRVRNRWTEIDSFHLWYEAEILQHHAIARWLLGRGLDRPQLARAAAQMADWLLGPQRPWLRRRDLLAFVHYLQAAGVAMVAGDAATADRLMEVKVGFIEPYRRVFDALRAVWRERPVPSPAARDAFLAVYDEIRDPRFRHRPGEEDPVFSPRPVAFELSIVYAQYLTGGSPDLDPRPERVIEELGR